MPSDKPSIADLYLAFRQAKAALFFERRGVGLSELAKYEENLSRNLTRLQGKLAKGRWFDQLEIGQAFLVPKRFHGQQETDDLVVRIGSASQGQPRPIDIQVRLAPTPDFAITEILYLWQFGPLLELGLSEDVLGYRLDLRANGQQKYRRWIFEYWPKRYQQFRSAPLDAARRILDDRAGALILSGDFASFYDTVAPEFLLSPEFISGLKNEGANSETIRRFRRATESLLSSFAKFRAKVSARLTIPVTVGIPIGALTSRVIANVSLASFDSHVSSNKQIVCYKRYVDDFVIVVRSEEIESADEVARKYLPLIQGNNELLLFDTNKLRRAGSEFQIQKRKIRVHHLAGEPGSDFVDAVASDFMKALSEHRAFIDASTLIGDGVEHLIRARNAAGSALRVLREADRARLERFALSTNLRSLERVTSMVNSTEAREIVRASLERVGRVLDAEDNWVDDLNVALRLLKLAITTGDWRSAQELNDRMDRVWGTADALRNAIGRIFYRGEQIEPRRKLPWVWLRNYLHERRLEAICTCLPIGVGAREIDSRFPGGILFRTKEVKAITLRRRAEMLAAADLRARDREDDRAFEDVALGRSLASMRKVLSVDHILKSQLISIDKFVARCRELGDRPWLMSAERLYLSTRPPSYFDVSRRWLLRVEEQGFDDSVFEELIEIVNAIRGTNYIDPVGSVLNRHTIRIEGESSADAVVGEPQDPRILLGNLVVSNDAWLAAASRISGSRDGRPLLTKNRLRGLADVLEKAERSSRGRRSSVLVLPELSLPRQWFRVVSNHVVKSGRFGLVAGLEYFHHRDSPYVSNQVFAVLPGPCRSVATWPWTKLLPAREEEIALSNLRTPVTFRPPPSRPLPRTVIHSEWGTFSVLICSELIEVRRIADLLRRVQVVLCPAWNQDTASYDHLIQSVGFQLHSIIAVANNGTYSDCRAWAPRTERWERNLCRLIERGVNDIVHVDLPIRSLAAVHDGEKQRGDQFRSLQRALNNRQYAKAKRELDRLVEKQPGLWRPLPPDWRDD